MKKLFALVSNGGDGSYSIVYTFNEDWIKQREADYEAGNVDYEYGVGIDGDGFHYDTLMVPEQCTLENMGIYSDVAD